MPLLGFGTYQLKGDACIRAVAHALAIGYRRGLLLDPLVTAHATEPTRIFMQTLTLRASIEMKPRSPKAFEDREYHGRIFGLLPSCSPKTKAPRPMKLASIRCVDSILISA